MLIKKIPAFFPFLLYQTAFAGVTPFSNLNLPKASSLQVVLFVCFCSILVLLIVVLEIVKIKKQKTSEKKASDARFLETKKKFSLNDDEEKLLLAMTQKIGLSNPSEIFESIMLFEQAVHTEVTDSLTVEREYSSLELEVLLQSLRKKLHFTIIEPGLPIVSTRNISSGQSVWILSPKNSVLCDALITRVQELSFSIKLSAQEIRHLPTVGSNVRIAFTRKTDGIYGIEVPLISFDVSKATLHCRHTMQFKRNQLRKDVRVETNLSITLRCLKTMNGGKPSQESFMVKMTDLSGGGLAFVCSRKLEIGDMVMVSAATTKLMMSGSQAKILALSQMRDSNNFLYHAQFINISFEKQEIIVKYVFNRLREINQR